MNITDPIRRQAAATPHAAAFVRRNATVSYRQLDRLLDAMARRALDGGLRAGDLVALAFPDVPGSGAEFRYFTLALALARAGIATMSADASDDASDDAIAACFADNARNAVPAPSRVIVDDAWFAAPPDTVAVAPVPSHADGAAICRILTTSGTTGTSKRIAISHEIMMRRLSGSAVGSPYPAKPVVVVHMGPWTNIGFRHTLRALYAGGAIVLARKPDELLRAVEQRGVNYLLLAPAALAALVDVVPERGGPLHGLEWVEVTGAYLPQVLYERARERLGPSIVTSYGSSEAGNTAWALRSDLEGRPGAVGRVLPDVTVEAVDDEDRPLPPGATGILRLRGPGSVRGYWRDDEASAQAFRGGWFYPGDLGSVAADRMLTIAGRAQDVINVGGNKIHPRVIEEALLAVPGVADAVAFGVPGANGIPEVWAALVVPGELAKKRLEETCRQLGYAAPKRIVRVAALPRNPTGKVLRGELAALATRSTVAGGVASDGPPRAADAS